MQGVAGLFLSILAYHLPTLLALLVGVILAISYWQRARTAAILMLSGAAIIFMTTTGFAMLSLVLMLADLGEKTSSLGLGYAGSWLQGIGIGLLIAAVFAERNETSRTKTVEKMEELVMSGLEQEVEK